MTERLTRGSILRIVLVYAAFAALWILLSDQAVEGLYAGSAYLNQANTLKSLLFVVVTTLLLYGTLLRFGHAGAGSQGCFGQLTGLSFMFLAPIIIMVTGIAMALSIKRTQEKEFVRLHAIADLKTRQIEDWLRERLGDAEFVHHSIFFADLYHRWQDLGDEASGAMLTARLEQLCRYRRFSAVSLFDAEGRRLWATPDAPAEPAPALRATLEMARRERKINRGQPYRGLAGHPRLDWVVPLAESAGPSPLIVLHVAPADWLYPALQNWPVPSASGETLLFRRDGDAVLFLNELRHRKDTAARLRIPVAREETLTARALRRDVRPGEALVGRDYRDVPAIGASKSVTGTDWFLLAKLDRTEVYGEAVEDVVWIGLAGVLALFMTGAGAIVLRQRQQLMIAESTRQAQEERLRALQLLTSITDGSADAIFAKDLEGRYILFNRAAGAMVGKSPEDVLGQDDRAIFPAEQAEVLMAADRLVIARNRPQVQEEELDTVFGRRVFLATKGPLRDSQGRGIGIFGISRDITARKQAEEALRESESRYRNLFTHSPDAIFVNQQDRLILANEACRRLFGARTEDELVGKSPYELFHPQCHAAIRERIRRMRATGAAAPALEERIVRFDGVVVDVEVVAAPFVHGGAPAIHVILRDISVRKVAEQELCRQTGELQSRNAELERFNRAIVGRELDMIELKRQVNELSRRLGLEPPYHLPGPDSPAMDRSDQDCPA